MSEMFLGKFRKFSKAMMGAVLYLPVIGLALSLTVILGNFGGGVTLLKSISDMLGGTLWPLFGNLGLIFAVAITYGLVKDKKAEAALLAVIVFIMFLGANSKFLEITNQVIPMPADGQLAGTGQTMTLGFRVVDMGIFLGIILGIITSIVHNKFSDVEFNGPLALYGGTKFVFMIMVPITILLAILLSYIWPFIATGIKNTTLFMKEAGSAGVFVYGFFEKFLIPTGLHHLVWSPFQLTQIGGTVVKDGITYAGTNAIFFAEMADKNTTLMNEALRFSQQGMTCMFGLPGAALAFYTTAKKHKLDQAKAILIPATLTAMLVGITEPIEFTFLFISPFLWLLHSTLTASFQAILNVFEIRPWGAGGFIDFFLYDLTREPSVTRWPYFILVGLVMFAVYFVLFRFIVLKFSLKTPGREDDDEDVKLYSKEDYLANTEERIKNIVEGLGGKGNIETLDNCFTRLRVVLKDVNLLNEALLKQTGASGVVRAKDNNVQVIYGVTVTGIKNKVDKYLGITN